MNQEQIYFTFVQEEEAALLAASEEIDNLRTFLEKKLGVGAVDAIWAFAAALKRYPRILENDHHLLEDLKAVLAKKNSLQQKLRNITSN